MDNENLNPYDQMMPQPDDPDKNSEKNKERKKHGFAAGVGVGVAAGTAGTIVIAIVGVFIYMAVFGHTLGEGLTTAGNELLDSSTVSKVDELKSYIDKYYYDDYDKEELQNGILQGLVEGLGDQYSVYYTADDYKQLQEATTGTYYGIGAALKQDADTKQVTIKKIYSGTPSEEAGLKEGDEIISVGDTDATSEELSDLVKEIRGDEGTTVHLKVYRASTDETFEVDVERKNVELPSVEGQMLDNGVAYMRISEFQTNTAQQFGDMLDGFENSGMKGLIVDLRGNPGGLVTAVTDIVDRILPAEKVGDLPEGTVVYTKDKSGHTETYGQDDGKQINCPIVVLVDKNSASASEIFAGAMKDYTEDGYIDATLVGTTTFGKGIVQTIYPLEDGDAVKITTSKYYTPNGNNIHGVGIDPDVEIEYEYTGDKNADYDMQYDNQLQKAIEVMNEKL